MTDREQDSGADAAPIDDPCQPLSEPDPGRTREEARAVVTEELLEHTPWLRRLARSLVACDEDAEDLVQEVWVAALRTPPVPDRLRGWMRRVLVNGAATATGRSRASRAREERVARSVAVPSPSIELERRATMKRIEAQLEALPDTQRQAILLRFHDGLPPREIAVRLELPVATVQSRIRRGIAQIRHRLDVQGRQRGDLRAAQLPLFEHDRLCSRLTTAPGPETTRWPSSRRRRCNPTDFADRFPGRLG